MTKTSNEDAKQQFSEPWWFKEFTDEQRASIRKYVAILRKDWEAEQPPPPKATLAQYMEWRAVFPDGVERLVSWKSVPDELRGLAHDIDNRCRGAAVIDWVEDCESLRMAAEFIEHALRITATKPEKP
jgi:hypothetical protein